MINQNAPPHQAKTNTTYIQHKSPTPKAATYNIQHKSHKERTIPTPHQRTASCAKRRAEIRGCVGMPISTAFRLEGSARLRLEAIRARGFSTLNFCIPLCVLGSRLPGTQNSMTKPIDRFAADPGPVHPGDRHCSGGQSAGHESSGARGQMDVGLRGPRGPGPSLERLRLGFGLQEMAHGQKPGALQMAHGHNMVVGKQFALLLIVV